MSSTTQDIGGDGGGGWGDSGGSGGSGSSGGGDDCVTIVLLPMFYEHILYKTIHCFVRFPCKLTAHFSQMTVNVST